MILSSLIKNLDLRLKKLKTALSLHSSCVISGQLCGKLFTEKPIKPSDHHAHLSLPLQSWFLITHVASGLETEDKNEFLTSIKPFCHGHIIIVLSAIVAVLCCKDYAYSHAPSTLK